MVLAEDVPLSSNRWMQHTPEDRRCAGSKGASCAKDGAVAGGTAIVPRYCRSLLLMQSVPLTKHDNE
jgi:hypothetical protein